MKKKIIVLFLVVFVLYPSFCFSEEIFNDEIIETQKESVNIGKFIEEAKKYTGAAVCR